MQRVQRSTTRLGAAMLAVAAIAFGVVLSGCDTAPENANQVTEGQGIKLDNLLFNVQITRQLNPGDTEDKAYLVGQKELGPDEYYLGVFMRIDNEGDVSEQVPTDMEIKDTVGTTYKPLPSDSLFALGLGDTIHAGDELPEGESVAANGPIQGSMVLFRITSQAIEDRPLTLHITTAKGSTGEVELDI
jgi:hypothetical protein